MILSQSQDLFNIAIQNLLKVILKSILGMIKLILNIYEMPGTCVYVKTGDMGVTSIRVFLLKSFSSYHPSLIATNIFISFYSLSLFSQNMEIALKD